MSRVPSRSTAPRTPLAMRDCNFLKPRRLAPDALAGDQAEPRRAGLERRDQRRDEGRIVLAVAVERHHDRRPRLGTPLRIAADWPHDCAWRICRNQGLAISPRNSCRRGVARSVIDIDDLEGAARQRGGDLADQRRDIAGLVAHRHDDRDGRI